MARRRPLLIAYVVAVVPAALMALTQPVWSRVDEAQHTDFVIQLSHGVYPLADRTLIDPETLRLTQGTGVYRFEGPGSYPVPDVTDLGPPPPGMSPRANAVWMSRHLWQLSYESAQTPAYYVAMVPAWLVADRVAGTLGAVYVLRLINALLVALLAPLAVMVARLVAPGRPAAGGLAGLFAAVLPGLDLNVTRVGNDAPAIVLGGVVILLAVQATGTGWTARRALAIGGVLGAAVLVKLTLLGLAPAVAVAMLWPSPRTSLQRRVVLLALAGGVTLACLAVWFAINLHLYGVPVPSLRTNRLSIVPPLPFDVRFIPFELAFFVVTYWSGEPLGVLPFATAFVALGAALTLIAAAGLVRLRGSGGVVLVCLTALAGMAAVALVLPATAAFQFAGPGRYEYAALPATAALLAAGLVLAIPPELPRLTLASMYGFLAAVLLVGGAAGAGSQPEPGGARVPPPGSPLVTSSTRAAFGGVSIGVEGVAFDASNHGTWLAVSATNRSASEAEWSPVPAVHSGSQSVAADYARSTQLPGDLEPGQSVSGWVYVPAEFGRGQVLRVVFSGVATAGYQAVGDVTLEVAT